jgi:hypothetical protein
MGTTAYSYSKIKRYTDCPKSYELTYLKKVGQDSTDEMEIGKAGHKFFELWHNAIRVHQATGKLMPKLVDVAAEAWADSPHPAGLFAEYLSLCREFADNYHPEQLPAGAQSIAEMELSFNGELNPCLWDDQDCYIRMVIDRVDIIGNRAVITDYKTGYGGKADKFQVELYCFGLKLKFPQIERFEVILHYVRTGYKEPWKIHADNLGPIEFQLRAQISAIEKDKTYQAKPGRRCQSCTVAAFCDKKASKLVQITAPKDAQKLAADVAVLEAQLKAKKEALKDWVKEHGEVTVNGLMFGFFPSEQYQINVGEFIAACREIDVDPLALLKADTTKVKKLCREKAEVAEALSAAITVETKLRFDAKLDKQDKQKDAA